MWNGIKARAAYHLNSSRADQAEKQILCLEPEGAELVCILKILS